MRLTSICAGMLALGLGTTLAAFPAPARAAEPIGYQWTMPWDQPPPEFKEVERQGFHDGVQGAMKDYNHHRFPNVENRKEYKKPHVQPALRDDYRKGYRRGYDEAMHHLMESGGHHS